MTLFRNHGATTPDRAGFAALAQEATVIPVVRELVSDWWTPVAAFHRLAGSEANVFLLESVEGGERIGRYSFLGRRPYLVVEANGDTLSVSGADAARHPQQNGPPLTALKEIIGRYRVPPASQLPPFVSGAVGYFGYDTVRWVEQLPENTGDPAACPDLTLFFLEEVAVFDHLHRRLFLVANARPDGHSSPAAAHDAAVARLDTMQAALFQAAAPPKGAPTVASTPGAPDAAEPGSNFSRPEFEAAVMKAKEYISAGDVFQVVLSQRFSLPTAADDLTLYRALRAVNPSPYMFLLRMDGWSAVGSSPEPLLRATQHRLEYRPIAGTAPRSGDDDEDARRAEALRNDPKEQAEHVMLVDLGRNDLGRCAVTGSVRVEELMIVERYSHVMHLVSGLSATLHPDLSPLDALYACFPAGTVSGAPKVRAMEIIAELEPERRGIYAGAVGYLDFSGNLDTCITLRTMVLRDGEVTVQAGAGIVADSEPAKEYDETRHKAAALLEAVRFAARLDGIGR